MRRGRVHVVAIFLEELRIWRSARAKMQFVHTCVKTFWLPKTSCTHYARNLIVFSIVNARRNVVLVYCADLISSGSSVATLVLKNRCERVATDNSKSWSMSKECLRIFSGAIFLPPFSILQGH